MAWCLSPPVGGFTAWTVTTPRMSSGTSCPLASTSSCLTLWFSLQVRAGGLQLPVLASSGPRHSGQEFLSSYPRPGSDPALPRPGRPGLTLRISSLTILTIVTLAWPGAPNL